MYLLLSICKRHFAFILALAIFPLLSNAQKAEEASALIGLSLYQGDLTPTPASARQAGIAFGGAYRYFFDSQKAFKVAVNYARLKGDLKDHPEFFSPERNLEMKAGLFELTANIEWHPFGLARFNDVGLFIPNWTPYISVGLGLAFADANVTTGPEFKGRIPESDDKSTFLVVPLTGGLRFDLTEEITLGMEIGARPVFSDYLDGISQNGNPDAGDWYWIGGVSAIFYIKGEVGRTTTTDIRKKRRAEKRRNKGS